MLTPAATDLPAMPCAIARYCRKPASGMVGIVVARRMDNDRHCCTHRALGMRHEWQVQHPPVLDAQALSTPGSMPADWSLAILIGITFLAISSVFQCIAWIFRRRASVPAVGRNDCSSMKISVRINDPARDGSCIFRERHVARRQCQAGRPGWSWGQIVSRQQALLRGWPGRHGPFRGCHTLSGSAMPLQLSDYIAVQL